MVQFDRNVDFQIPAGKTDPRMGQILFICSAEGGTEGKCLKRLSPPVSSFIIRHNLCESKGTLTMASL